MNRITRFAVGAVWISAVWGPAAWAAVEVLESPDGSIRVAVEVRNAPDGRRNCLFWSVSRQGRTVIADSTLGLKLRKAAALDRGFSILTASHHSHDGTWKPVCGERSEIRDAYNALDVDVRDENDPPRRMRVRFRAYDEGVALCYVLPEQDALREFVIESEDTRFGFSGDHPAWAVYSAQGRYEETTLDKIRPNCERPLTVRIADDLYAAVAEARLVDYARMRLGPVPDRPHTLVSMLAGAVEATAPFATPWRVILIGRSPGQLLERNSLLLNLNEPCAIEDTSWIRPGKAIREVTLTTAGGKACVDFAVRQGLQYIEYDAGWYGPEGDDRSDATTVTVDPQRSRGPLDLPEVIRYANQKGIGVWLYVNRRALERQLDEILPLYRSWGVRGVKFGFVQVGSQRWTRWLHEAIRKAGEHRLLVDVHDEYRPTGFERTYPNLLTMEGIGGNEVMPPAEQDLVYPFTRYLCGPADYTICWYDGRVKNTRAHQLAAAVVYYSPLQFVYWYDRPGQFGGEPETEFFRRVPTVWDETRVLHGRIGEYVTVARRRRADWFVGSMNAVERRRLDIPLSFLPAGRMYQAVIYQDRNPDATDRNRVDIRRIEVDCHDTITADLAANGGQAIRLTPKPEPQTRTESEPTSQAAREDLRKPAAFTVDADYPGGNILIERIEGDTVYCAPDTRDTRGKWFYWNFRVRRAAARTLTFQFVGTDPLGARGPALSCDRGQTWSWLGAEAVKDRSFSYTFAADADEVRFAFAVPYTRADLERFLACRKTDLRLRIETLCRTRGGRNCLRLHVGGSGDGSGDESGSKPGVEPRHRLLLVCRHHACETMASFVLEGALDRMLSDTETGRWYRQHAEVLAIPFMDTDGVEDGDQGKNRIPHDHNRDYDGTSIYPAVAALRQFVPDWSRGRLHVAVDLHCPHIRGPNNETIYQVGNQDPCLWAEQVRLAGLLEAVRTGPLKYAASDDMIFGRSWNTAAAADRPSRFRLWAGRLEQIKLATTFEIPYASVAGREVNADTCRAFGRDLAEALRRYLETLP